VLGAHLGVVAVRLDLNNRARNDAANTYERPALANKLARVAWSMRSGTNSP
jgi:hypothetical protein